MDILNTINTYGAKVEAYLASILPVANLTALAEKLAMQLVPESAYQLILNGAIHGVAFLDQVNARIAAWGEQSTPVGICGLAVQNALQAATATNAGSAVLKAIPSYIAPVLTLIGSVTVTTQATDETKAVSISLAPAVQDANQKLIEAQALQIATLKAEIAKLTPAPDPSPDVNTDAGMGTPGEPS